MRVTTRLGGALAVTGLMAGLVVAGTGTASATAACPAWSGAQPPSPPVPARSDVNPALFSVAVAGPCDVWMVGGNRVDGGPEQPLIEHWTGGPSWAIVPVPSVGTDVFLNSVSAASATDIWAVGTDGGGSTATAVMLHWDGTSWTQKPVPGAGNTALGAVAAVSARNVWAAGTSNGQALLLHYDGTGWTPSPLPALTPAPDPGDSQFAGISGLDAISSSDVWAVGSVQASGQENTLALHWDGTGWTQASTPPSNGTAQNFLSAVSASSPGDAWAVGTTRSGSTRSTLTLHWDGHSWATVPSPNPGGVFNQLFDVASISPASALAVGIIADTTGPSRAVALHWDGQHWTQIPSLNPGGGANLFGVAAGPAGVWAAGEIETPGASNSVFSPGAMIFATVPNVAGDSQAAATAAMDSAGLHATITAVTTAGGGCGPATNGTIITTTPAAGTFTAPPVSMTFCDFPPVVTVPAVTGLNDSQAQGTLTNAGLAVGTVTLIGNCDFPPGTVIRQNPAAGTTANRGTAVNLTEATPPKPHGCAQ